MALDMEAGRDQIASSGPRAGHDRGARALAYGLPALGILAVAMLLISVMTGASTASVTGLIRNLLLGGSDNALDVLRDRIVITEVRMPRAAVGFLVGAALAASGATMQGLFRNPLADPGVLGVTSGASLGAVSSIVLGGTVLAPITAILGIFTLPVMAFIGALIVTFILYRLGRRDGETQIATMLIAGIAISALGMALTGLLIYVADDNQIRDITFWSLGSLAGSTWQKAAIAAAVILPALLTLPFLARGLNAFTLGEAAAFHMGVPVERFKRVAIVMVAAATGVSVALSGGIVFIGMIVPHLIRIWVGPDHRFLLPASALLGGSLLLVADMITRVIVAPAELPIGILTALIGAPFFLWILLKDRSGRVM
ncbi:iron ABC transporter permease [Rhizobium sp. TH2]|uniref:FecCD family ABC transporter permease n=1 Tax=Rhizobium sp. TH2 TaxID=2775403 RepID=UPI002157CA9B|nr:iron ABC transporter permease [Rhizobium sp. TH2]UVC09639.1 iron ABC transporter permease [Rhizobium sp. TH2]